MTTKEMIAVMQASEEGKTIQFRRSFRPEMAWIDHENAAWNWAEFEYRVKPEPMEIEVWVHNDGITMALGSKRDSQWWTLKKFREVIE